MYKKLQELKDWLKEFVENMGQQTIKYIVGNHHCLEVFIRGLKQ